VLTSFQVSINGISGIWELGQKSFSDKTTFRDLRTNSKNEFAEELMPITGAQCGEPLRKFSFRKPVTVDHDPHALRDIPNVLQRI
jgi:hypothetical protein